MTDLFGAISQTFRNMADALSACCQAFTKLADSIDKAVKQVAAIKWAETAKPDLVRIMNRTKKKRTRKKCMSRIMREYELWRNSYYGKADR